MSSTLRASELYAISQSNRCTGPEGCHWCGAACGRLWLHDEPPAILGVRRDRLALNPNGLYICIGCWLWRRKRVTVNFLPHTDGNGAPTYLDRQEAPKWSWLVTEAGSWALREGDAQALVSFLVAPPLRFFLSLLDGNTPPPNHLQMCLANNFEQIGGDTPLRFTINNIPHQYTVYELEDVLTGGGVVGKEPGVRALASFLKLKIDAREVKTKAGRPKMPEHQPGKIVTGKNAGG